MHEINHMSDIYTLDKNENHKRYFRNAAFISSKCQRIYIHRPKAFEVRNDNVGSKIIKAADRYRFCAERLTSLVRTLELSNIEEYMHLQEVATFASLVATYDRGFLLILEPFESETATVPSPVLHFACLDASIAIAPVFDRFSSVIITSGTISPLEMYPRMLSFDPVIMQSYPMTLARKTFLPLIVTRGGDQQVVSSGFNIRNDPGVVRNYGALLVEFSKITPDGLVVFFPSYLYMESIISMWQGMGILDELWRFKLLLVETPDSQETSLALETYRTACCNGRGAVLLCVARGKVSEGIDFDHHYGRTVICMGIPFQYTESRILKARLQFLRENYDIMENDFLSFDAMRHAAQCLGRVLRGKDDYGVMVLADKRFAKKKNQLPKWISQYLAEGDGNMSTDMAVGAAKRFLRSMAQQFTDDGVSTWSKDDLNEYIRMQGAQPDLVEEMGETELQTKGNYSCAGGERALVGDREVMDLIAMDVKN